MSLIWGSLLCPDQLHTVPFQSSLCLVFLLPPTENILFLLARCFILHLSPCTQFLRGHSRICSIGSTQIHDSSLIYIYSCQFHVFSISPSILALNSPHRPGSYTCPQIVHLANHLLFMQLTSIALCFFHCFSAYGYAYPQIVTDYNLFGYSPTYQFASY